MITAIHITWRKSSYWIREALPRVLSILNKNLDLQVAHKIWQYYWEPKMTKKITQQNINKNYHNIQLATLRNGQNSEMSSN